MPILRKAWNDGSGDVLTVSKSSGTGNDSFEISSVQNEGTDRKMQVSVSAGSVVSKITVFQTGKREVFLANDGSFKTSDGHQFNVLK